MSNEDIKEFINDIVEFYLSKCEKGELDLNLKSFRDFVNQTYENYVLMLKCQTEILEEGNE